LKRDLGEGGGSRAVSAPEAACACAKELLRDEKYPELNRLIADCDEVEHRAMFEMRLASGNTLLHALVKKQRGELVDAILATEIADIECRNEFDKTPLHMAAQAGSVEIVQALMRAGADVRATYGESRTSVGGLALSCGRASVVRYLWSMGLEIDPKEESRSGHSALESVSALDDVELFELMLSAGKVEVDPVASLLDLLEYDAYRVFARCLDVPALAAVLAESPLRTEIDAKMQDRCRMHLHAWLSERAIVAMIGEGAIASGLVRSARASGPAL
jgi:hypothetical protein